MLALSRLQQKEAGVRRSFDWKSIALRPFAEEYPKKDTTGSSLASRRVGRYFRVPAYRNAGSESEELRRCQIKALAAGLPSRFHFSASGTFAEDSPLLLELACFLTTLAGLLFELLRQSIAMSTNQDSSRTISLIPYFTTNGGARKEIQERIAQNLTNRVIAENGLSGVSWSLGPGHIKRQLKRLQENPKGTKTYARSDKLEQEFHATTQQTSDAQPGAPSELLVICPRCDDTLPHEHAPPTTIKHCQEKCKQCQASGGPCDLSRSLGACTSCHSSGKTCHLDPLKGYGGFYLWQCGRCLWRCTPLGSKKSNGRRTHSERDCIGRCNRCKDGDLTCRILNFNGDQNSKPSGNGDCIFCLEMGVERVRM